MVATGYYVNVFDEEVDVLVILNEPNDEPKPEEVDKIEELVLANKDDLEKMRAALIDSKLNCLRFDFQGVHIRKWRNEKGETKSENE